MLINNGLQTLKLITTFIPFSTVDMDK